ncbi:uncharacterized protein LOC100824276 isoform X2 [Brachypodium distachyon]|uniref:Uncharacterized protein n=1 Tax=Brachypodium distachyon TaxID=15368 RepID=A0A2K2D6G1_BRADI|nr:uncharacterized protein LOC100824276 isoform X2 [Brachypodium distachyon]PNT69869.1 hypothetical protein BRADI_2g01752v3 [Brachypodium distachyon]|eukprot:XP_024315638.1 uncharacterized protein LOC100824276 isoform X2 [Brachypodium distachyon]
MLKVKRIARGSKGWKGNRKRVKEVPSIFSDREAVAENPSQELCCNELSQELATKLSPSIVSLASFDGDKMHYKSTGIVIENSALDTGILTSSALVCTSDSERRFMYTLKIKVYLPNDLVVEGCIRRYDLPSSMVIILINAFSPDLSTACFSNTVQVEPHSELLAVKRCFESGKLMVTRVVPSDSHSEVGTKLFLFSTCKITMDGSGGPLVDSDGNFLGMNDYHDQEGTRYVQGNIIGECLNGIWFREYLRKHHIKNRLKPRLEGSSSENSSSRASASKNKRHGVPFVLEPQASELTEDTHLRTLPPWPSNYFTKMINDVLKYDGYPLPAYADGRGMHLVGDFEEEFGRDILSEPASRVALKMSRCVVALASYNDTERHFACTGVFIDCNESTTRVLTSASLIRTSGDENKIVDNLRIDVCLPSNKCIQGKLEKYDFCYNVAVISITRFRNNRSAMLVEEPQTEPRAAMSVEAPQTEVVALGRVFKSGNFMATEGLVTGEQCKFDCKRLKVSTCKITKAGIGGPLFDFKGNFVGMNFYDTEGTPYLRSNMILEVLRSFNAERTVAAGNAEMPDYRWPVPKPYWHYSSHHEPREEIQPGMEELQ